MIAHHAARTRVVAGLSVSNAFASVTASFLRSFFFFPHFYLVMKERRKISNVAIRARNTGTGHSLCRADPSHSSFHFFSFFPLFPLFSLAVNGNK